MRSCASPPHRPRVVHVSVVTPLLESPALNARIGGRLLVKAEPLQRTGSFKFRGAYNRLSQLTADQRKRGVVAYSSGNHAQGVACAAKILGIPAVIVMPADAPAIKVRNTRSYGAEVVHYDRYKEDREAVVLFASDDLTAHTLAAAGCEVVPAPPGRYRDQGSEAVVVVQDETTYTVEEGW